MARQPTSLAAARRRLQLVFGAAFLALALPTVFLVVQAFKQLELDAFRRLQLDAEQLVGTLDASLATLVAQANARSFADFGFLVDDDGAAPTRSELAAYPVPATIPGLIAHFQVDADGTLTTPLLPPDEVDPSAYGVSATELEARRAIAARLRGVLAENRIARRAASGAAASSDDEDRAGLRAAAAAQSDEDRAAAGVAGDGDAPEAAAEDAALEADETPMEDTPEEAAAAERVVGQAVFDQLSSQSAPVANARQARPEAALANRAPAAPATASADSLGQPRRERALDEIAVVAEEGPAVDAGENTEVLVTAGSIDVFTSELEPFSFSRLDTGHFVLFRDAWRAERRVVQGALIEQATFVDALFAGPFAESPLADHAELALTHAGSPLRSTTSADSDVLLRARLSPPFADLELSFAAVSLPPGPGRGLLVWLAIVLAIVLPAAFALAYRFSWRQLALARQQQDFVAAVSHELKTPLTSIRMYGEMLKAGWADDAKRRSYYDYIYNESERLSRLIENVLQLARITRQGLELETRPHSVAALLDLVRSKVATRVEQAGFELSVECPEALGGASVEVDADSFVQIAINLVDNAVKFSTDAAERVVAVGAHAERDGRIAFTVRDFGPGVPRRTMRKLFELFYRPDNELTRATAGTGIGLALVKQLAEAMNGKVDVRNVEPGAEFVVSLPIAAAEE